MFTDNQTGGGGGVVYKENSKGHRTEPWGTPRRSWQTSDKVEPIDLPYMSTGTGCLSYAHEYDPTPA